MRIFEWLERISWKLERFHDLRLAFFHPLHNPCNRIMVNWGNTSYHWYEFRLDVCRLRIHVLTASLIVTLSLSLWLSLIVLALQLFLIIHEWELFKHAETPLGKGIPLSLVSILHEWKTYALPWYVRVFGGLLVVTMGRCAISLESRQRQKWLFSLTTSFALLVPKQTRKTSYIPALEEVIHDFVMSPQGHRNALIVIYRSILLIADCWLVWLFAKISGVLDKWRLSR